MTDAAAPTTPRNAAEHDRQSYLAARDNSFQDLLLYAHRKTGRPVLDIHREYKALNHSIQRINMVEYIRNGLYDITRHTPQERGAFISNDLHWDITHQCNNRGWTCAAEDKVLADTLLRAGGVPVPASLAVIDRTPRLFHDLPSLRDADALRGFLKAHVGTPLFIKIIDGMVSFGAARIDAADDTHIHCAGLPPLTYDVFLQNFVGSNSYVVQRALYNHPDFAAYASGLATVRLVNLVTDAGVVVPMSVIKLPQGGNIADAFWRPGNLACDIDPATGRIQTVTRRGVETDFLPDHPEVPGLTGLTLPHWDEVLRINDQAARLYAPIRYQSTDIAITPDGPVVVELNYGGGFDLPQYASGRGLLTPEVKTFFEGCGYTFTVPPKRRFALLRGIAKRITGRK